MFMEVGMNYYNMTIKQVIREFPAVGDALAIYEVDCATCEVGTCLLKDILDVHNFPDEQKKTVMAQIDKIINGEEVNVSLIKPLTARAVATFSSSIQQLVNEHKNIMRLLNLAQYIADKRKIDAEMLELARQVIFYVGNYADKYHHAKEENILFVKANPDNAMVKVMLAEHELARGFIRQAADEVESNNADQLKIAFRDYAELLQEHIRKEDKILYPWFENYLNDRDKDNMQKEFEAADQAFPAELVSGLPQFLDNNYA